VNLYALLGGLLAWLASVVAAAWWGIGVGQDREIATQAREEHVAAVATQAAASAAAEAISRIKVQHRTITQEVQREVLERPVYRDCVHSTDQLQRINAALTGAAPEPAGRGIVPAADTPR
jgi:hypothetical protein